MNWSEFSERYRTVINNRCQYCKEELARLDLHHIKPLKQGGTNNFSNLIALCSGCHKKAEAGTIEIKQKSRLTRKELETIIAVNTKNREANRVRNGPNVA